MYHFAYPREELESDGVSMKGRVWLTGAWSLTRGTVPRHPGSWSYQSENPSLERISFVALSASGIMGGRVWSFGACKLIGAVGSQLEGASCSPRVIHCDDLLVRILLNPANKRLFLTTDQWNGAGLPIWELGGRLFPLDANSALFSSLFHNNASQVECVDVVFGYWLRSWVRRSGQDTDPKSSTGPCPAL